MTVVSSTISSGKSASYVTQTLVDPSPITGKPPAGQAASSIPVPLVAGIFALAGAAAVAYKKIRDNQ